MKNDARRSRARRHEARTTGSRFPTGAVRAVLSLTLIAVLLCAPARAANRTLPATIPVTGMEGWPEDHNRVTGLALAVEDAGWPTLSMLAGDPDAAVIGALRGSTARPGHLTPCAITFGCVAVGRGGRLKEQQANEVSNRLVFGNDRDDLSLTVTRLSPALLLESDAATVELFAREERELYPAPAKTTPPAPGVVKPLRWAAPAADGVVRTGILGTQQAGELPSMDWETRVARAEPCSADDPAAPPLGQLGRPWLLLWYGSDSPLASSKVPQSILPGPTYPGLPRASTLFQADVPLLLVFGRAPKAIELKGDGDAARFLISFDGGAGKLAVLPLFGHDLRPAAETERWLETFPDEVRERCEAWASCLAEFPVDVKETAAYDGETDRVTLANEFSYIRLSPGGRRFAPVPPMLALACSQGLPVRFSQEPTDLRCPTQFGPMMGIAGDGYSWSMDGLGGLVRARRAVGAPTPGTAALEGELAAEVSKVLDAGHLAPWRQIMRHYEFQHFSDPADTLYLLCEALPALPPDLQGRLADYLRAEYGAYPPQQTAELPLEAGARREVQTHFPEGFFDRHLDYGGPTYVHEPGLPIYRAYGVARYFEAVGEKPPRQVVEAYGESMRVALEARDWASLSWFWGKYSRVHGRNPHRSVKGEDFAGYVRLRHFAVAPRHVHRDAAGLIGYLRLCRLAGRPAEEEAWGQLARLAALRFALARYGQYLAVSGFFKMPEDEETQALLSRSTDFSRPENHMQQVLCVNQHGVFMHANVSKELSQYNYSNSRGEYCSHTVYEVAFQDLSPEFARIMAHFELSADAQRLLDFFEEVHSTWFVRHADDLHVGRSEQVYTYPTDSHELFMAHAWLAGTPPERLERYIDVPWTPLGDLFYMHKLAETIKAYRGVEWVEN